MRLNIWNRTVAFSCIVCGLLSGCAKSPDKELAETKAAIQAAIMQKRTNIWLNFQNVQKGLEAIEAGAKQKNSFFCPANTPLQLNC